MIVNRQLLALLAIPAASAFTVKAPLSSSTRLQSSFMPDVGQDTGLGMDGPEASGLSNAGPGLGEGSAADMQLTKNVWDTLSPVTVQGGSLRTWSFSTPAVKRVQVLLRTEGRPLNANVDLWQGPDNTPQKMGVYIEDGSLRPFCAVIETPRGQNAIAIRNTGEMEFPLAAAVEADIEDAATPNGSVGLGNVVKNLADMAIPETVQGGAIRTYSFAPSVASVQVLMKTDGRPLNARIELLQGPNNNKQVIELYTEDGLERPFFAVIETPGVGNVVRVINTAPVEFPLTARVQPYLVEPGANADNVVVSSGGGGRVGYDRVMF